MKIYAIKDQAIEAFGQPFFVQAQGMAVRMFMDETRNRESQISKHPEDFELWYLGEYEPTTGLYRDWETDRKSTRLNSSHSGESRMPSSA